MTPDGARGLRLLADENVQGALVQALRRDALDVAYVAEGPCGITDEDVLHLAVADQRVLLTEDKDFGELVFRLKRRVPGLILIRFTGFDAITRHMRLRALVDRYGHGLYGRYVVVTAERFRLRNMPEPSS